jgi:hypothetical protein
VAHRVKHVEFGGVLSVETISGGRGAETYRHRFAASQVKTAQSPGVIGVATAVNAVPNAFDCRAPQQHLKMSTADHRQYLRSGRDTALAVEQC